MLFLLFSPSPSSSLVSLTRAFSLLPKTHFKMSTHAFAGNPIKQKTPKSTDPFSPNSALKTLKNLLLSQTHFPNPPNFRVLPFRKGRPLAGSSSRDDDPEAPNWHLGWLELGLVRAFLGNKEAGVRRFMRVREIPRRGITWRFIGLWMCRTGMCCLVILGVERCVLLRELRTLMVATPE